MSCEKNVGIISQDLLSPEIVVRSVVVSDTWLTRL